MKLAENENETEGGDDNDDRKRGINTPRRRSLLLVRSGREVHHVAAAPLHIAFDALRGDVHDGVLGRGGSIQSLRPVHQRCVVACVRMRVRNVVHLHGGVVRRA